MSGLVRADFNFGNTFGFWNFKPSNTRAWRKALANVRSGTANASLACAGDSTTTGQGANTGTNGLTGACALAYPALLATILNKVIPAQESAIWGDKGRTETNYNAYDPRLTVNASWAANQASAMGQAMWRNSADSNALAFAPGISTDTCDVYYYANTGNGTLTIDIGGAAVATQDTSTGGPLLKKVTGTFSAGVNTINIKRSAGGAVFVNGIVAYLSTAKTVLVHNLGRSGSKVANLAAITNAWDYGLGLVALNPDMTLIDIGINDEAVPTDLTSFGTDLATVITKATVGGGNAILVIPHPVSTASATQANQDALRQKVYAIAAANDLPVIDLAVLMESYTIANAQGFMYDALHATKLGYSVEAGLIAQALTFLG